MSILAGISAVQITPPIGVELAGYSFGASVGVLDELIRPGALFAAG